MRTGVPFIVHDGTAGMLFDPRVWDGGGAIQAGTEEVRDTGGWMRLWSWFSLLPFFLNRILGAWRKEKELGGFGSVLRQWNQGNFRWQVTGIGVGDPSTFSATWSLEPLRILRPTGPIPRRRVRS